jgi:hypothetical protein
MQRDNNKEKSVPARRVGRPADQRRPSTSAVLPALRIEAGRPADELLEMPIEERCGRRGRGAEVGHDPEPAEMRENDWGNLSAAYALSLAWSAGERKGLSVANVRGAATDVSAT